MLKLHLGQNMNEFKKDSDSTLGAKFGISFPEKASGMAFIRKVFSILMVQFAIPVGFIWLYIHNESVRNYIAEQPDMTRVANFTVFIWTVLMLCCDYVKKSFPINFICLFIYTFAESFHLGVAVYAYKAEEVTWAAGICAFIFLSLTAFSFQTKYDFTTMKGFLLVALPCFVIFGVFDIFHHDKIVQLVYTCVYPLMFSIFLVYDTQCFIGSHHKYLISPEEYIFEKCWIPPAGYIFGFLKFYLDIYY